MILTLWLTGDLEERNELHVLQEITKIVQDQNSQV